ncbi:MAG TPA: flagellar biosynthetic protein FliR [Chloroflexota bacterium]|nr:flagellar biosynthetic protein FliR [Chloroflexota bacterium]
MLDVAAFPANYFGNFFLVFVRVSAMLFSAPLINGRTVPAMAKVGFGLLLTMILLPLNAPHLVEVPFQWLPLSLLVLKETGVGVLVGFTANMVFYAMQLAGQFVGMQTGFSVANVLDPLFSQSVSIVDQLYTLMAGLIFLGIDGHHMLILAIQQTLDIVPVGMFQVTEPMTNQMIGITGGVLVAGLRIILPILTSLLLADIALGLVTRTVPQMNVFIVGMPLKLFIGFFLVIFTLPSLQTLTANMFRSTFIDIQNVLQASV